MVKDYKGSLIDSPANIIVHQANCMHTFGNGLAKVIKEKYPEAFEVDLTTPKSLEKMGGFSYEFIERDSRIVINLYGQGKWGRDMRYTNYEAVAVGLLQIKFFIQDVLSKFIKYEDQFAKKKLINDSGISSNVILGFPYKMGCGTGGADWRVIRAMIDAEFEAVPYDVLICKLPE